MVKAMKKVALSEVKDDLSRYIRMAEKEAILITRHGKPAGVLVGFTSEDDWLDYRLENDPRLTRNASRTVWCYYGYRIGMKSGDESPHSCACERIELAGCKSLPEWV
jgi:prevent-host-death family protein